MISYHFLCKATISIRVQKVPHIPSVILQRHCCSPEVFGSLVVCLPTCFSGGALVTRHHQQEVKVDSSSSSDSPMQKLSWAAFLCDVEHEVLPVTAGYRITLTYNLCGHKSPVSTLHLTLDITTSPLYCELRSALSNQVAKHYIMKYNLQHMCS